MEHIKYFNTINDRIAFTKSKEYVEPHISYTLEDKMVKINNKVTTYNDNLNRYNNIWDEYTQYYINISTDLDDNEIRINLDDLSVLCNVKYGYSFSCDIENNIIEIKQLKECDTIIYYNIFGSSDNASVNIIALSDVIVILNDINLKTKLDESEEAYNDSININNDAHKTKIYVNGQNTINSSYNYAIICSGDLEISGDGNLNIYNKIFGINSNNLTLNNANILIKLSDIYNEVYGNAIDANDIYINSSSLSITTNNISGIDCTNIVVDDNSIINILANENRCISAQNNISFYNNSNITLYSNGICSIDCNHLCCNNCYLLYTTDTLSLLPATQTSQYALYGVNIYSGQYISFVEDIKDKLIAEYSIPYTYTGSDRIIVTNPKIKEDKEYWQNVGINNKYKLTSHKLAVCEIDH